VPYMGRRAEVDAVNATIRTQHAYILSMGPGTSFPARSKRWMPQSDRAGAGMTHNPCPPFQDIKTLSANTCLSESTIEGLVEQGRFPQPRRKKCGKRLWVWDEVFKFLSEPEDAQAEGRAVYEKTRRAFGIGA
jgi:predicted DNA-binding transcriptional regulator AlpA